MIADVARFIAGDCATGRGLALDSDGVGAHLYVAGLVRDQYRGLVSTVLADVLAYIGSHRPVADSPCPGESSPAAHQQENTSPAR
ncbi:hypothetical protein [Streptomyces sp. NPDC057694]|uniref:hypothetical protein n=1 Tax=Streptomyces sp. NPDC057694 TaxID=3346216 RepID=UPI0036AC8894